MSFKFLLCLEIALLAGSSADTLTEEQNCAGTEFIFGMVKSEPRHKPAIIIVAGSDDATVKIAAPKYQNSSPKKSADPDVVLDLKTTTLEFKLGAGESKVVKVGPNIFAEENDKSRGILVESDYNIVVYGKYYAHGDQSRVRSDSEIFQVLPSYVVGAENYMVFVSFYNPSFVITGIEDATSGAIQVTGRSDLPFTVDRFEAFTTMGFLLNKQRAFLVVSSKPVVVLTIQRNVQAGFFDKRGSNIVAETSRPNYVLGTTYYTYSTPNGTGDNIRLAAKDEATSVTVNDNTPYTLNPGAHKDHKTKPNEYLRIKSDKPITVASYTNAQTGFGDLSFTYLIPMEQWVNWCRWRASASLKSKPDAKSDDYAVIHINKTHTSGLRLDGAALPAGVTWTLIRDDIVVGYVPVTPRSSHYIKHQDPKVVFSCTAVTSTQAYTQAYPANERMLRHGSWGHWGEWELCQCGYRNRHRHCNNPFPLNGGNRCSGPRYSNKSCRSTTCETTSPAPTTCPEQDNTARNVAIASGSGSALLLLLLLLMKLRRASESTEPAASELQSVPDDSQLKKGKTSPKPAKLKSAPDDSQAPAPDDSQAPAPDSPEKNENDDG